MVRIHRPDQSVVSVSSGMMCGNGTSSYNISNKVVTEKCWWYRRSPRPLAICGSFQFLLTTKRHMIMSRKRIPKEGPVQPVKGSRAREPGSTTSCNPCHKQSQTTLYQWLLN
ncbi:uncharacterized protein LOC128683417 [Plodia interpunctella]|uniref:uncharacterized protein LOC128683417 n=1 Tax=Plodia interpunctella TaxID=58824 RepID=UPI002368508A|nr:uncharacterized protein LOC128683417 [Plodia interpunctella]